jgi:phosphoglycolate phosphatase
VPETIAALAEAGWEMGVATSDGTAGTHAALSALGLERFLPHVFGYDAVARPKPAPDCVFAFAAATGLDPDEIAVVGDNPHDLEMARSAGAAAVGVLSGNSRREDFGALADAVLDSVCDLPEWLAGRAAVG